MTAVLAAVIILAATPSATAEPATHAAAVPVALHDGDRLLRENNVREAAREYVRAVQSAPNDVALRLATGVLLAAAGDGNAALAQFRAAVALAENDVVASLLLEEALREQGRAVEAQNLMFATVRRFGSDTPSAGATVLDASGSISRLREAVRRFPQSAVMHLLLGDAYQVAERWKPAGDAYRRAAVLAPKWARPHVHLGIAYLSQDRADEAIRAFEAALVREPRNTQVLLNKGDAEAKAGRPVAALKTFRKVAGARDERAEARMRIGQVQLQSGQTLEAIRNFDVAQRLLPTSPAPLLGKAEAQVKVGNYAAGADAYRSALKLAREGGGLLSSRPMLYRGLAEAQLSARKPDAALETLAQALREEPQNRPLWHRLTAEAHFAGRDRAAGEAALRRALESDVGRYPLDILNAIAGRNLIVSVTGAYEAEAGRRDEVGRRAVALVALAHLAQYAGNVSGEVAYRQQAVAARPLATNWFLLADALRRSRRYPEAHRAYRSALRQGPGGAGSEPNDLPERLAAEAREWLQKLPER